MTRRKSTEPLEPEWSHMFHIEDLGEKPFRLEIFPDAEQKKALARRLKVVKINALKAVIMLQKIRGSVSIHVQGDLEAEIVQHCVITLEPLTKRVSDHFEAWFAEPTNAVSLARAKADLMMQKGAAEVPMVEESEDPEPIEDGRIDLGELSTQFLSLAIDPYPHKEGALESTETQETASTPSAERRNPFAALKDWKNRHSGGGE